MFSARTKIIPDSTAKRNGRRDAAKGIPDQNDSPHVVSTGSMFAGNGYRERRQIECASTFEAQIVYKSLAVVHGLFEQWVKVEAKLKSLQDEAQSRFNQARENYEQRKEERGRDAFFERIPWWYWPLIVTLGIAELYLNRQVFVNWGLENHHTWVLGLLLSFSLPIAGHFLGIFMRERPWNKTMLGWSAVTIVIVAAVIVFIAKLREDVLQSTELAANNDPSNWMLFIALNALVLMVSIAAAYCSHEEDPHLMKYKQDFLAAHKALLSTKGERNSLKGPCERKVKAVAERGNELIQIYRQANLRARKDGQIPPLFKTTHPEISTPPFDQEKYADS